MVRRVPGPKGIPIWGVLHRYKKNPTQFLLNTVKQYGDIARFRFAAINVYLISNPDWIRYVFQENSDNYVRRINYEKMKVVLGNSLLTTDGEPWRERRRLMQPNFHHQKIASFAAVMTGLSGDMLRRWELMRRPTVDIAREMMMLTQKIIMQTMFSVNPMAESEQFADAFSILNDYMAYRLRTVLPFPEHWPTLRNRRFHRARELIDRTIYRMIAARRQEMGDHGDLLAMLLAAQDEETGKGLTDRELRDELITIFFAGHETTANALAWTFYLIAGHEPVARRLQSELQKVLAGRIPTLQALGSLNYTRMVIEEAMRLYPPAPVIGRTVLKDDVIGGCPILADSLVFASAYAMHHHPRYWLDPEHFIPERFEKEKVAARPRYAYIPFGVGPHLCIGNSFAMIEAQLILAMVASRYRLTLASDRNIEPEMLVTLRPRGGVPVTLTPLG